MTLIHPGSADSHSHSHSHSHSPLRGVGERGYPASLSAMVAEQRTADLSRATRLARTARQTAIASPRGASALVNALGAVGAVSAARVALAQALTRHAPRGATRRDSKGAALTGSSSQLACCA